MIWKKPHISKLYEALTAIADGRIKKDSETSAKCYSTSGNKYYEIEYDPKTHSIMSNDNTAFYTGSLSYPMIAFLMLNGEIKYDESLLKPLSGIFWKDINQKFKNNYDRAIIFVLKDLKEKGFDILDIQNKIRAIYDNVCRLEISHLGDLKEPPKAY